MILKSTSSTARIIGGSFQGKTVTPRTGKFIESLRISNIGLSFKTLFLKLEVILGGHMDFFTSWEMASN